MSKSFTAARRRGLGLWVFCCVLASPARAADPFYENLLSEGKAAAARADWPLASARLRLACFGLLEEPVRLADCLARLANAQSAAGDREGFSATAERLLEIEQRFSAYSAARLDAALRRELETALERQVEPERLLAVPVFAALGHRMLEKRIAALPAEARRRELESRLAAEPDHRVWKLLLVSLELETGHPEAALEGLDGLLGTAVPPPEVRCLRGLARAALGACGEALADLGSCKEPAADLRTAEAVLGCQVRLGRWAEAEALLALLPETLKQEGTIRRLTRDVRKGARTAARASAPTVPEPPVEPAAAAAGSGAAPSAVLPAELGPEPRAELAEARRLLGRAATAGELDTAFASVRRIADANPGVAEAQHLVAEIAYRTSRWAEVITYFERGGAIDASRPDLQFYLAVAQYEAGDPELAAETLRACQGRLRETEFVRAYTKKILGGGP